MRHPEEFVEAGKNYEIAIDIRPDFVDALYYFGKLLAGGLTVDKDGMPTCRKDPATAKTHFKEVIRLDPEFSKAYYNLARIEVDERKLTAAKKNLETAIRLDPSHSKAHFF